MSLSKISTLSLHAHCNSVTAKQWKVYVASLKVNEIQWTSEFSVSRSNWKFQWSKIWYLMFGFLGISVTELQNSTVTELHFLNNVNLHLELKNNCYIKIIILHWGLFIFTFMPNCNNSGAKILIFRYFKHFFCTKRDFFSKWPLRVSDRSQTLFFFY